jgi:hypothetical protein
MPKITLAEARESGAVGLLAYCDGRGADGVLCGRSGSLGPIGPMIERYGPGRRLDALPVRCACGSRETDVRPEFPSQPVSPLGPHLFVASKA